MTLNAPLAFCRVVDLGIGMAGALLTKLLVEAGASVTRIEPAGGDPFYRTYPAYRHWHSGKILRSNGIASETTDLAEADLCVVGGEDYPGLDWHHNASDLAARFPHLVIVDIAGYASPLAGDPIFAVDLLVQATMGLVYEQKSARPIYHTLPDASYGAALQGLIGALAALWERRRSGKGQILSTSLQQGTLAWRSMHWFDASDIPAKKRPTVPKDAQQLICRCKDGVYIHFTKGGKGASLRLNNILGIDDESVTADTPSVNLNVPPHLFFGDLNLIARHAAAWESGALIAALTENGITAEHVLEPGACWSDEQVEHNRIITSDQTGTRYVGCPIAVTSASRFSAASANPSATSGEDASPLAGIKILDLGSYVAGPSASRLLGDLGAEVIKLEPAIGDPARILVPGFAMANRGKTAIVVDLKTPEGGEILRKICLQCDIVQHNFRADIARRLGVDAPSLQRLQPDLIVLETTGYGASGPKTALPAFDMVLQALCGHEQRFGGVGNRPEWNRFASVDTATGMIGAVAMLLALFAREERQEALALDLNLLNTGIFLLSELIRHGDGRFEGAPPTNESQTGLRVTERLYQAKDGWIAIAARTEAMAKSLAKTLKLENALPDGSAAWGAEEATRLADAISQWTVADLVEALSQADVWAAICRNDTERELLRDPGLERVGAIVAAHDPRAGETRQIGAAFSFSRSPLATHARAHVPGLGEHTRAVLKQIGYSAAETADLYERRVVA